MTPSNLEILAYEKTPLGDLCLRRRELHEAGRGHRDLSRRRRLSA
jgi:hypothetical protein